MTDTAPTREDVLKARETIGARLPRTPLLTSRTIGARLKCELFQRTGSFKARGALNRISSLSSEEREARRDRDQRRQPRPGSRVRRRHGEHRRARRHVAGRVRAEDRRDTRLRRDRRPRGDEPGEAFERLNTLIEETGRTLVHPFDCPIVIAGAGTVGLEIEEDAPDADAVVVPVGGGGLISGIQTAIGHKTRVIAIEPETSTALHTAIEHGQPTPVTPTSIADGLNAPFAGALPLEICGHLERHTVTEDEIEHAFRFLYERAKLACEPAGAAATAAWLAGKIDAQNPVLLVSGGNVASRTAAAILARP